MVSLPPLLTPIFFVFGLILGSFGNMLISRLPEGRSIGGRSRCLHCGRQLSAWDLIPLLSYILLKGKCRRCHADISPRYLLVEVVSGALFVLALSLHPFSLIEAFLLGIALWFLLVIAVIDVQWQAIPDVLNFPFIFLGFLLNAFSGTLDPSGMLLGGGFFGLQWVLSRGRWTGSGDIFIGIGIGALLGSWRNMALCLSFAYIVGAAVAIFLLVSHRKTRKDQLAFGPFLAIGAVLTLLFGELLIPLFLP